MMPQPKDRRLTQVASSKDGDLLKEVRRPTAFTQVSGDHRQRNVKTDPVNGQQTDRQQNFLAKFGDREDDAEFFKHRGSMHPSGPPTIGGGGGRGGRVYPDATKISNRSPAAVCSSAPWAKRSTSTNERPRGPCYRQSFFNAATRSAGVRLGASFSIVPPAALIFSSADLLKR